MSKSLSSFRDLVVIILVISICTMTHPAFADPPPGDYDHSNSQGNQLILRAAAGKLSALQTRYGLNVIDQNPQDVALVTPTDSADIEALAQTLAQDIDVEEVEVVRLASLPRDHGTNLATPTPSLWNNLQRAGTVSRRCLSNTQLEAMWSGYTDQSALDLVNLPEAQFVSLDCGAGVTVAVIDTGVDPEHPALIDALVPGYDFLLDMAGTASEWSVLDPVEQDLVKDELRAKATQSVQQILEGEGDIIVLGSSMGVVLDPALTISLEGMPLDSYFGHGTMVAGLVRIAAPRASIMPLRVFDDSGSANLYDIVEAIYYAVDHGADVINMSFSMDEPSKELKRALKYAHNNGTLVVAAAGNEGVQTIVYPAAYGRAIGVASVTNDDELSDFSNYGANLVKMAAPGDAVVSSFPGNHYAAGWGTSYSTPLVAGSIALLYPMYNIDNSPANLHYLLDDLYKGTENVEAGSMVGKGRLDAFGSFVSFVQTLLQ